MTRLTFRVVEGCCSDIHHGHYGVRMYHPLVASIAETGDMLDVRLREGNVHSANGALEFIEELLGRVEKEICEVAAVRFDAGFPEEKLLAKLEERGTPYVARVRNTSVLKGVHSYSAPLPSTPSPTTRCACC